MTYHEEAVLVVAEDKDRKGTSQAVSARTVVQMMGTYICALCRRV